MNSYELDLYQWDKSDPADFMGFRYFNRIVRPILNDPETRVLTDNKWLFYQLARSLRLPIPVTLALLDKTYGVTTDGKPCRTVEQLLELVEVQRPKTLVIKPTGGIQGMGIVIFDEIDYSSGIGVLRTGVEADLRTELNNLPETRRRTGSGYVIQEAVPQHPDLLEINPQAAYTVRVVTHMTLEGAVFPTMGAIRLGRGRAMAGNWEQGGVSVGIELETGMMTTGVLKPKFGGHWVTSHPETGVEFVGRRIPMWPQTVELARHAARLFPAVRSIGWDIIISPDGPVILEANENWGMEVVQVHTRGWLAQPLIREDLANSGIPLPDHVPTIGETLIQMGKRRVAKLGRRLTS